MIPECSKCSGKMEYHPGNGDCKYAGPHWYCLTANCGGLVFPHWIPLYEGKRESAHKLADVPAAPASPGPAQARVTLRDGVQRIVDQLREDSSLAKEPEVAYVCGKVAERLEKVLAAPAPAPADRVAALEAALRDVQMGCNQMLNSGPNLKYRQWFENYSKFIGAALAAQKD